MYKINPFLMHELDTNEYVIQTNCSTVIINNDKLISFLKKIEENNISIISDNYAENDFNNQEGDEFFTFLISNKIICKETEIVYNTERIICCTNNINFNTMFNIAFASYYDTLFISTKEIYNFNFKIGDLCLLFLEPFQYKEFLDMDLILKKNNIITKFLFYYNYSIYISNFYRYEWHIPCPKCFFSGLENHLRGAQVSDNINFQLLIDLIYQKKIDFPISGNLKTFDLITVIYILQNQLLAFFSKENYVISEICEIALPTYKIIKDNAVYWEICDCYE